MTVTERVMGLGDWTVRLSESTPPSVLSTISTPFATIVITPTRINSDVVADGSILSSALFSGVVLRPGPQLQLGGAGLAWFLGDDKGGAGVYEAGFAWSATTNSDAVADIVLDTAFTSGTVTNLNTVTLSTGLIDRRTALSIVASNSGYEWLISPARVVSLAPVATLYGATPTGIIVRRDGGREISTPQGITGRVSSTWDWSTYGSKAFVWSKQGYGSSGGASPYYDPAGNAMTIVRGFEEPEAPTSSESTIAAWWLGQINRTVRTVDITTDDYGVTGSVPCGGQVYLYDPDQGLYDSTVQVQYQGQLLAPVSARIVSVTWPVKRGMGVYYRAHNGSAATYTDLSDYVEWESGDTRYEVSTAQQSLAPPTSSPGLSTFFSPWQPYTPTWYAATTQPAIGNGALLGSFRRLGTTLEVNIKMQIGTTTTFGTGGWWHYSLPPDCLGASSDFTHVNLNWMATDLTNAYTGQGVVTGGLSTVTPQYGNPVVGIDVATPFNWATAPSGSNLNISGTLEVRL